MHPIWYRHLKDSFESVDHIDICPQFALIYVDVISYEVGFFFHLITCNWFLRPSKVGLILCSWNLSLLFLYKTHGFFVIHYDILLRFNNEVVSLRTCSHGNMASSHCCRLYSCLNFWDFSLRKNETDKSFQNQINCNMQVSNNDCSIL